MRKEDALKIKKQITSQVPTSDTSLLMASSLISLQTPELNEVLSQSVKLNYIKTML
jgi:hypothetical protein